MTKDEGNAADGRFSAASVWRDHFRRKGGYSHTLPGGSEVFFVVRFQSLCYFPQQYGRVVRLHQVGAGPQPVGPLLTAGDLCQEDDRDVSGCGRPQPAVRRRWKPAPSRYEGFEYNQVRVSSCAMT